ncbi:MAG: alpha-L-arabinofuranosidase C-terminal domain-containing protein [Gammaproteobacteria bacterium]
MLPGIRYIYFRYWSMNWILIFCILYGLFGCKHEERTADVLTNISKTQFNTKQLSCVAFSHDWVMTPPCHTSYRATVTIEANQYIRDVPETLFGANIEWIFDGQGLWDTEQGQLNSQVIELTRNLGVSILRYPGGVFSDYFHWRQGLTQQRTRQSLQHYPSGPTSRLSFGIREAERFAQSSGAQLLLTVNAGTGTASEAAEWVRYMNLSGVATPVRYWEIGNELYMRNDLSGGYVKPETYATRFLDFTSAMRAEDANIKLCAIGGLNYGRYHFVEDEQWNQKILSRIASEMDCLSVHNAYAPVLIESLNDLDPVQVYASLLAAPINIERNLHDLSTQLAHWETTQRSIRIAVTEWGPFFHVKPNNPWVDHVKTLGSSLFVSGTLNVFLRTPRVEIANFFKLTDHGFMGWLGRRDGQWIPTAPYYVFKLYRDHLQKTVVQSSQKSPTYTSHSIGVVDGVQNVPYVDTLATRGEHHLSIFILNRHPTSSAKLNLHVKGVHHLGVATQYVVTGNAIDAHTGSNLPKIPGISWGKPVTLSRFSKGAQDEIVVSSLSVPTTVSPEPNTASFVLPARSVSAVVFSNVHF